MASGNTPVPNKYTIPSWAALVDACNELQWFDTNDVALKESQLAKAKSKSARKPRKPRPRAVSAEVAQRIDEYRNARLEEMTIGHLSPKPPLWLRNRTHDRVVLIADVWRARETLMAENRKHTSGEILKWLKARNQIKGDQPASIKKRIEEALKRVDTLLESGEWPDFEAYPDPAQLPNNGFHPDLVHTVLEP